MSNDVFFNRYPNSSALKVHLMDAQTIKEHLAEAEDGVRREVHQEKSLKGMENTCPSKLFLEAEPFLYFPIYCAKISAKPNRHEDALKIQEYIWLVNTIRRARRITFAERWRNGLTRT